MRISGNISIQPLLITPAGDILFDMSIRIALNNNDYYVNKRKTKTNTC